MTIISRRIITPIAGKSELALERAKRLAAIMGKAGAGARVARVIMGAGSGDIEVYGRYPDFRAGTKAFAAMSADAQMKALIEEREKAPAAEFAGPFVYRSVYGELTAQPVVVQREYQVPRANLGKALELLPEVRAIFDKGAGIAAVVPVFAPAMDRLVVTYYVDSLDHLGHVLDETAMSEAFQGVVNKAAQHGALIASRVLATV